MSGFVTIFKGDDTNAFGQHLLDVAIKSDDVNFDGCKAYFKLGDIETKEFDLSGYTNILKIDFTAEETEMLPEGPINGTLWIIDNKTLRKTFTTCIPLFVTTSTCLGVIDETPYNLNVNVINQAGQVVDVIITSLVEGFNYSLATNKPSINGVELSGNKTSSDLGLATPADISKETNERTEVDNELQNQIDILEAVAKQANLAHAFDDYQDMITEINTDGKGLWAIGQSFMIKTLNVPDLWVSGIKDASVAYTYTSDEQFISDVNNGNGAVQVGFYMISFLETQKVDLSNYVSVDSSQTITGDKNFTGKLQQNGTDVLTSVPIASSTVIGGVRIYSGYGINIDSAHHRLFLTAASHSEIDAGTSSFKPIVVSNLEYGIQSKTQSSMDSEKTSLPPSISAVKAYINGQLVGNLTNTATGSESLTLLGVATSNVQSTNLGATSEATADHATAIGEGAKAQATGSVGIGWEAKVSGDNAVQLGAGINTTAQTLQFNGYRVIDTDGSVPATRLFRAAIPNWTSMEARLNDTEYTADATGTFLIQITNNSTSVLTIDGTQIPISAMSSLPVRIGKGSTYKFTAGDTSGISLLWIPDKM